MQVSYITGGNTAEDVNTIFSRKDCFVNVVGCGSSPTNREYKEKVRAKKKLIAAL